MDFDFTSEQTQLKDSVDRFVAGQYGSLEARERMRKLPGGYDQKVWAGYAELGLLGIPFTDEDGGFGGGPVETMIAMEAIGRNLALDPICRQAFSRRRRSVLVRMRRKKSC
jgi:alkylation response protein AidB-like acyl-CoA dehydrogenase